MAPILWVRCCGGGGGGLMRTMLGVGGTQKILIASAKRKPMVVLAGGLTQGTGQCLV